MAKRRPAARPASRSTRTNPKTRRAPRKGTTKSASSSRRTTGTSRTVARRPAKAAAAGKKTKAAKKAKKTTTKPRAGGKGTTAAPKAKAAARKAIKPAAPPARPRREPEPVIPSPPSSLDMKRRGSAARTGRAELAEQRADHATMTPAITAGDVDVNVEDAYFTGDEAPGGDNPTPDQDVVDEIGKALGVEYQDDEELQSGDKVAERDRHRWELDPASAEDYRERNKR